MTRHKKAPVGAGALKRRRNVYNGMVSQKLACKKDGDQYKNSDWDRQLQVWKDAPIASLFAEEKGEGFWRLQTEDVHLKKLMNPKDFKE